MALRHDEVAVLMITLAVIPRVSVDFLSLIERGINAPSFEVLEQMAGRLRLPVMALFDFRTTGN
jgi:transcriptional regulator with XRE-family HTH domain